MLKIIFGALAVTSAVKGPREIFLFWDVLYKKQFVDDHICERTIIKQQRQNGPLDLFFSLSQLLKRLAAHLFLHVHLAR